MTPPQPQHATDLRLGPFARLAGYDLAPPTGGIRPGQTLTVTLHWQATASADRSYTVFVHLLDEGSAIRGYGDAEPDDGRSPTTGWLPGEYLADRHTITVGAAAAAGRYRLAIGLYDPASGQRLTTPAGADRVEVGIGD
jgi:hypothetical protein